MNKDILYIFGKRIRQLRMERRMTQEFLAEAADLDRTYISDVERGKRNVSLKAIQSLASGLNVPIASLFPENVINEEENTNE